MTETNINALCSVEAVFDGLDIEVTVEFSAGGGTFEHDELTAESRAKANQHPIPSITGLQSALDGKSNVGHGHDISGISGLTLADSPEFADTKITPLATEATYTPTVWSYLVGLFTTVPKSVKEHLVKIWTIINAIAFVEPITEVETFTLALTHLYKGIRCNSATDVDCNIPLNDTVAFPVGSIVTIQQIGNGVVTVKGVSGVTLNGDAKTAGQYKFIQLWKTNTNVWNVIGGVA